MARHRHIESRRTPEETLRATLDCLAEVIAAVRGRAPVFVDGGIRRGTDIFKALALGATTVGIGRPQAWDSRPSARQASKP